MAKMSEKIEVKMFGKFSVRYKEKTVDFGNKNTSKFVQLLQIILLSGKNGATKDQLFDALYGFEDMKNQNNSMNNLIYRLRKQLTENGFLGECIVLDGNHYIWNRKNPVDLDVDRFETLVEQAGRREESGEEVLKKAFDIYQGELLPAVANETWVITRSLELKKKYAWCVEQLGKLLREKKEYQPLYGIYKKAAKIYPYDEWQGGEIDCLIAMERYGEAYRLYSDALTLYSGEMGILPSEEVMGKLRNISDRVINAAGDLDCIRRKMQETELASGAYFCAYPSFMDICQVILRSLERSGNTAYFLMCTMVDSKYHPVPDEKKLEEMAARLQEAIKNALRRGDFYTRYSRSQFLIVLKNIKKENCTVISDRINRAAAAAGYKGKVSYHIAEFTSLFMEEDGETVLFGSGNQK